MQLDNGIDKGDWTDVHNSNHGNVVVLKNEQLLEYHLYFLSPKVETAFCNKKRRI